MTSETRAQEIRPMTETTPQTWTTEAIEALFREAHDAADAANREATRGPFNPFGDAFEDLTWYGSIREAWEQEEWERLAEAVNEDREAAEELTWEDWEANEAEIGDKAKEIADTVVGTGRAVAVAFCDGAYPAVFCELASEEQVRDAVASFYDAD
jgi:hypothetical protein